MIWKTTNHETLRPLQSKGQVQDPNRLRTGEVMRSLFARVVEYFHPARRAYGDRAVMLDVIALVRERFNVAEIGEAFGLCHEDAYREFMRAMTVINREDRREHKIQSDRDYRRRKRVLKLQQSALR